MSSVGLLILGAILGAFICAKTRSAAGAVVFSLLALVLFIGTPVGQGLPGAISSVMSTVDQATTPALTGAERAEVGGSAMSRDWRSRAACREEDPELFFPTAASGSTFEERVEAAKEVCGGCPVRAACLAEALERLPYGIAGGLTEGERRDLRRGTPVSNLQQRRAGEGQRLLSRGDSPRQVAEQCRVSERTAQRWAAAVRASRAVA